MVPKSSSRFLIRHTKRLSEAAQRKWVEPGDVVYVIGKDTREDWISSLRKGDTAKVSHAALIAEPKTRRNPKDPIADLRAAIDAICKTGAVVVEASTGLRSDDVCQVKDMILGAVQGIRSGRRGGVKDGAGRPRTEFTEKELITIDRIWNRRGLTRDQALKLLKEKFGQKDKRINDTAIRRAMKRLAESSAEG